MFHGTDDTHCRSSHLHAWDPVEHLCFIHLCNFQTLHRFRHSWQVSTINLWNTLPVDILLSSDNYMAGVPHSSKHSTMYCMNMVNYFVHVVEVSYSKNRLESLLLCWFLSSSSKCDESVYTLYQNKNVFVIMKNWFISKRYRTTIMNHDSGSW